MTRLQQAPTREYRTPVMDSRRWNDLEPREGDILVATYPKCGTTWTQRLVDMLIHQSTDPRPIMETYPWVDATFFAPIDEVLASLSAQTHRRAMKTHLPFDSLPIWDTTKYIHVARDGRDACFSFHNHQQGFSEEGKMRIGQVAMSDPLFADAPPPPETPDDPREFYLDWLAKAEMDPLPVGVDLSFFDYEMTYWRERSRPNLLLVHYNDLKADLRGEVARISRFLEIDTPPGLLDEIAAAGQFEAMKSQGASLLPVLTTFFDRGHDRFLNKGTNGRWKDVLGSEDLARYADLASRRLTAAAAAWIEHGRLVAGDPEAAPD
jgi:aryl sulfotransferase